VSDVVLRRADASDADFVAELFNHDEVDPFLGPRRPRDGADVLEEIELSQSEPEAHGLLVVEVDGERAGTMSYRRVSEPNRIAHLGGLALHPAFRGRGVADRAARELQRLLFDLGYHRLELAVYGFNERGIAHAERAGFVREGVKRKAYLRHGEWQDAIQYGLLREDVE
jgi:L-phenylalanine/L-methionine N-acetyltransferase